MEIESSKQIAWASRGAELLSIEIPSPLLEIMPGIHWGCASDLFTPAFWKYQSAAARKIGVSYNFRLGNSIVEEVTACLLGGYGMPAELALAAFYRLRERNLINDIAKREALETALSEPFDFESGARRYRFPRQKASYLWRALQTLNSASLPESARSMRDFLLKLPGIGPKTASWIVRNHFGSDDVAILDVHIMRAGAVMGLFWATANPAREYFKLENRFLAFCEAIEEPASVVDALMWDHMRRIGSARAIPF
ncbi:MAG: hypothetical protein G4V63_03420 [Candidatus Afipia apatlaquensis]|uniref:8-oxoguanine DNA glycosylase n=1 Tax=Candidatus Afipia apatlaquensis TaxID=2712852 RepID=A0A7C9VCG3_9BRAD|nr:hypothetical protein [Candidatus Afipia apatlaquensis]